MLHDEPTRPSALSPGLVADPQWLAHRRRLQGDLDNILLKALDERIEHHYASVDALTVLPGGLAVKEDLLKGLIGNLDRMATEMGDDPDWQADLAAAYARLAELQGDDTGASLKKMADAGRNAARAIALGERAWPAKQHDAGFVQAYLRALQIQAQTLRANNQPADGVALLRRARGLADQALPQRAPAERRPVDLRRVALTLTQGMFTDQQSIASLNQPEQARALLADAEQQLNALDRTRGNRPSGDLLAALHGSRAISHARLGQLDAARHDAQQAIRFRERAVAQGPTNVAARDGLVTEATNGGVILLRLGVAAGALAATRQAWAQVQALARENGPGNKGLDAQPRVAQHHGRALLANGLYAEAALERLARPAKAGDATLNLGEACLFLGRAQPSARSLWLGRARQAYERAAQLRPLNGDHLANYREAGGKV